MTLEQLDQRRHGASRPDNSPIRASNTISRQSRSAASASTCDSAATRSSNTRSEPPGFLARWSSPKRLAGAAALVLALAAGLRWGPSLDGFRAPPPAGPFLPRPVRVVAPKDFIETCARAMDEHPPALLGWKVKRLRCVLGGAPWAGAGPRLVVEWSHYENSNVALDRLVADDELPDRWPWFQVLQNEAKASLPIDVRPRPAKNFPDPSVWRHDVDAAFFAHTRALNAKNLTVNAAAGTMSVLSDYGLPVLADLAARVPGLEITGIESTETGWKLTGRRVAAPGGRP